MRKFLSFALSVIIFMCLFVGCGSSTDTSAFVKPEKYAAIVNVSINPSFDIYLDDDAKILAVEPKNEDANKIDFSGVIGLELSDAMDDLVGIMQEMEFLNSDSLIVVTMIEGNENFANVNVVEVIEDAFDESIAKETVNSSMDSALMVRLKEWYGCKCEECIDWYGRLYSFGDWHWNWEADFNDYKARVKEHIDNLDKEDPQYQSMLESYQNLTLEKYKTVIAKLEYYAGHTATYSYCPHEEKEITYKIMESVSKPNGKGQNGTKEYTAEEFFAENPDRVGEIDGLQKAIHLVLEVYVNGELQGAESQSYFSCYAYQCNDKWYLNNGMIVSLNP
ncbi:MAG: hypothetical protein E7550_02595 [Ruminococcaceae bacterium]|nr:hypothetical protein [Oscillospiraceae bacterium]